MQSLVVDKTGVDHLYTDGLPIAEVSANISDIINYVARITSLVAQTDLFFAKHTMAQKYLSELHGEGTRIFADFLQLGATDILPVFQSMQRWMGVLKDSNDNLILMYEYDRLIPADPTANPPVIESNTGTIVYRWQIMDTRMADYKINYTSKTYGDIITDLNNVRHVQRYMIEALRDYVLREFYKTIGHVSKAREYARSYEQNRSYVAFWAKSDLSLQTGINNA